MVPCRASPVPPRNVVTSGRNNSPSTMMRPENTSIATVVAVNTPRASFTSPRPM